MSNTLLEQPNVEQRKAAHQGQVPASQFESYEAINTPKIVVVGFVSAILTFVVIVGLQAIYFAFEGSEMHRKTVNVESYDVQQALTQQQQKLSSYSWVDAEKGVVSIPISQAMDLVVDELSEESAGK